MPFTPAHCFDVPPVCPSQALPIYPPISRPINLPISTAIAVKQVDGICGWDRSRANPPYKTLTANPTSTPNLNPNPQTQPHPQPFHNSMIKSCTITVSLLLQLQPLHPYSQSQPYSQSGSRQPRSSDWLDWPYEVAAGFQAHIVVVYFIKQIPEEEPENHDLSRSTHVHEVMASCT